MKSIYLFLFYFTAVLGVIPSCSSYHLAAESDSKIIFHWENSFNKEEKNKIKTWLNTTANATQQVVGNFPFDLHFYIYRADGAKEPVPWGNTERSEIQGVTFHVNPDFSLEEFLHDWTAPHEISHLAIPFPGRSNKWFSEGFATYMQGKILVEMDEFTSEQISAKYQKKLANCRPYYQSDSPFVFVADSLKNRHHYPAMYWGSVTYFENLDRFLNRTKGKALNEYMDEYQSCCRLNDKNLDDFIRSLDQLTGNTYASELLDLYRFGKARNVIPAEG